MAVRPPKRINLLPSDLRPKLELQSEAIAFGLGALLIASATVSSTASHIAIKHRQRQLASIESEKHDLDVKITVLTAKNALTAQKVARYASFQEVLNRKTYWVEMFKELSGLMPEDVWLTGLRSTFSKHDRNLTLMGEASSQEKVAEFLGALEKSRYFNTVMMKDSEKEDDYRPDLYKFEFDIPVAPSAPGARS